MAPIVCKDTEKLDLWQIACQSVKWFINTGKQFYNFFENLNTHLPHNPGIELLGIHPPKNENLCPHSFILDFPGGTSGKEPASQCRRQKRCGFDPWVGKIPWRRAWQPNPVFLTGKSHGQRSLVGYNPEGFKESDMTEATDHACTVLFSVVKNW